MRTLTPAVRQTAHRGRLSREKRAHLHLPLHHTEPFNNQPSSLLRRLRIFLGHGLKHCCYFFDLAGRRRRPYVAEEMHHPWLPPDLGKEVGEVPNRFRTLDKRLYLLCINNPGFKVLFARKVDTFMRTILSIMSRYRGRKMFLRFEFSHTKRSSLCRHSRSSNLLSVEPHDRLLKGHL